MANQKNHEALNVDDALTSSEAFFVKNKKFIIGGAIALVVLIAAFILYKTQIKAPREEKASVALYKGEQYFGGGDYEKALNGDGQGYVGFVKIVSDYGSTKAGNLAKMYAGLCYAQTGKAAEAVKYLADFDLCGDQMVSPAALGALGNCYAQQNQLDKATETLRKAAKLADNNSLSPTFLIQAGEIFESQGKNAEALECYKEIKSKYFNSMQYQDIDKYIERATK